MEFGPLKRILVGVPILWFNARAAGISAPVEEPSFRLGASVVLTKFDKGMGVSPSTGLGGTLGFPLSPSVTLGAGLSFTSTGIPYETVGSISSIPVSLTELEASVRLPVWRPWELLTVSASAGAGLLLVATGAHRISAGAFGVRELPGHTETRFTLSAGVPLALHLGRALSLEAIPAISWVGGPAGPFTTISVRGGVGIAIP